MTQDGVNTNGLTHVQGLVQGGREQHRLGLSDLDRPLPQLAESMAGRYDREVARVAAVNKERG
jgi:hypothetical protein